VGGWASRTDPEGAPPCVSPPDDSGRNFDDLGSLDGVGILADSFLALCDPAGGNEELSGIRRRSWIPESKVFRRECLPVGDPTQRVPRPLKAAGSTVPPECNVPRRGRNLLRRREWSCRLDPIAVSECAGPSKSARFAVSGWKCESIKGWKGCDSVMQMQNLQPLLLGRTRTDVAAGCACSPLRLGKEAIGYCPGSPGDCPRCHSPRIYMR